MRRIRPTRRRYSGWATLGHPDAKKVRSGVELSFVDYRDVLMNEYDMRIDIQVSIVKARLEPSVSSVRPERP